MSPFERSLSTPDLRAVDLVDPGLLWGVEWIVDPAALLHRAGPTADLRRLLDVGSSALDRATGASREIARLSAVVAGSLATFARCRPGSLLDRPAGERGAMSAATGAARPAALTTVSEWAVDEVALALRIPGRTAEAQLADAVVLTERLPSTLALLARGELGLAHARQMVNVVAPVEDDVLRGEIEAHVLDLLGDKTPPQLADCARRIVLREDADAAARTLVAAVRERGVRLHDRRDGTGTVALDLPLPTAAAIYRSLEAVAEQARVDGDQRTKQQRMADCVADLVLRPGENGLPPVTVALTLVATLETMLGGSEPGRVEGMLVPAEMVRELGYTLGLMPRPAPDLAGLPDGVVDPPLREREAVEPWAEPTPAKDRSLADRMALVRAWSDAAAGEALGGARQAIGDGTWTDGEVRDVLDVGALLAARDVAGTGLAHRPRIAVADRLRGSLVALTDATAIRAGRPSARRR